jgi:hypothetical protein
MARPPVPAKKTVPPGGYKLIRTLAANGAREDEIARALHMGKRTWDRVKREDPKAEAAWEAGRAEEHNALRNTLFKAATEKNNIVAAMFLLKTRHGYREKGDEGGDGGRVTVEFKLPAPLDPESHDAVHAHAVSGARAVHPRGL